MTGRDATPAPGSPGGAGEGPSAATGPGARRARRLARWLAGGAMLVAAAGGGALLIARSDGGRAWLLRVLLPSANRLFDGRGTLHVRQLLALGPGRIRLQGVELRDRQGRVLVSADTVDGALAWRALRQRAVHLRHLAVRTVRVQLRQGDDGVWDLVALLFGAAPASPPGPPGWGDAVRIDALAVHDVVLTVVAPWAPHPAFTGSARDSVIAVRDSLHDLIQDRPGHYLERRLVVLREAAVRDLVLADPAHVPASLRLVQADGAVSDPLIPLRDAAGRLQWTGDSLWFALDRVALPSSVGRLAGHLDWYRPGPPRFDVAGTVTAALRDLRWAWEVLPPDGTGSAHLRFRTLEDPEVLAVALTTLDVASGPSRVTGGIEVVVEPTAVRLRDVALDFRPVTSALLRRISDGALPPQVSGLFTGRLEARRGGPVTAFPIDRLALAFADASAGGARSEVVLRGTVVAGSAPGVRGVAVERASLALASLRGVAPALPAVTGRLEVSGSVAAATAARLDRLVARLVWTDAAGGRSAVEVEAEGRRAGTRLIGGARARLAPLDLAAAARVDSTVPLQGRLTGEVELAGSPDSVAWRVALQALPLDSTPPAGWLRAAGVARLDSAAVATSLAATLTALDAAHWIGTPHVPSTALDGGLEGRVVFPRGGAAPTGALRMAVRQEASTARPAMAAAVAAAATPDRLLVDSLQVQAAGVALALRGALGRVADRQDTLTVSLRADSLGAVQRELDRLAAMWQPVDSAAAATMRQLAAQPVSGDLSLSGYLMGHVGELDATAALGGRQLAFGGVEVGRLFGSARGTRLRHAPAFELAATADDIDGVGALQLQEIEARVAQSAPGRGTVAFDLSTREDARLLVRGGYGQAGDSLLVRLDSIRLAAGGVSWRNDSTAVIVAAPTLVQVAPLALRSSAGGLLQLAADVPADRPVRGALRLERFPVGDLGALVAGTVPFDGTVSGAVSLEGTRTAPLLAWTMRADSLGFNGIALPPVTSTGRYADRLLAGAAELGDTAGGRLQVRAELPVDLALQTVSERLLSDQLVGEVRLDSLRLGALGVTVPGLSYPQGVLDGRLAVRGTLERPVADGLIEGRDLGARVEAAGIAPSDGRLVLRAAADSLRLETFRLRSGGPRDTVGVQGVFRFPAGAPASVRARLVASTFQAARQRDGTDLDVSGSLVVEGPARRPTVRGTVEIPRANLVVDPLAGGDALDLSSEAARALLGEEEVPVAESAARSLAALGRFVAVENARLTLGSDVWVQTPEARVKLTGSLGAAMSGEQLALEGEINAARGQYRLDLGVVNRSFAVDSGRVRFFGSSAIAPSLDLSASHVVRVAGGGEIPVRVHIGGSYDRPLLTLSSTDPLYASAPESELISLLIFGAPTFALDGQSRSTVRAVTGVLLPSVGGAVEGALQRLLPVFNTVQVTTAGGQTPQQLSALSLLDNLSISAGKQIGDRTFLRLNTGVCRSATAEAGGRGTSLWYGIAAEYRLGSGWLGQLGVDPGAAPCTRLGGDILPRMQFGVDLFREWIW